MSQKVEGKRIRQAAFLKNLAQYDPELAQELATADEPVEAIIARELTEWRIVKEQKYKEMDLETLLAAWSFFRELLKMALELYATANTMFFQQFLSSYEYTAAAVQEKMQRSTPNIRELIALKVLENVDRMFEKMENLPVMVASSMTGGKIKVEGGDSSGREEKQKKGGRRKKVSAKA